MIVGEPCSVVIELEEAPSRTVLYLNGPGMGHLYTVGTDAPATAVDATHFQLKFTPAQPGRYWVVADGFDADDNPVGANSNFVDVEPRQAPAAV